MATPISRPAGAHNGRGLDYTSPPSGGGAYLKSHGYEAVARYVSSSTWKRLTKAEIADYKKNGIALLLNFEDTATGANRGYSGGVTDAHKFVSVARGLGLTGQLTGYFSVDWDVTSAQMPTVMNYLRGVASVLGHDFTGVYGSFSVIRAAQKGVCKYYWASYAWAHGASVPAGIHWYQYSNGHNVGGADADLNQIMVTPDKWGAYGSVVPTPTPEPTPTPIASEDDDMTFQTLAVGDNVTPTVTAYLRNGGTTRYFVTSEFGDADFRIVCMRDGSWSAPVTLHVKSTDIPTLVCDADRMVEKISITRVAQVPSGKNILGTPLIPTEGTATLTVVHNS